MTRKRNAKPVPNLTANDLAEFDREFVVDTFKQLSARDRVRWERAQKKGGPIIQVRLDADLLDQVDSLAKKQRVSRDKLIIRGIKAVLVAAGER